MLRAETKPVDIRPDDYVVATWNREEIPTAPMQSPGNQAWAVGYGFIGVTRDGREVRFRPIIETAGGLQVARNADSFQGRVFVGLVDLRDPAAAYELPRPVALLVTGQADSVMPSRAAGFPAICPVRRGHLRRATGAICAVSRSHNPGLC